MITNKTGLPQPIVDAIINDDYDAGDSYITASSLWKSPRIRALEKQHSAILEQDASDGIFALIGKAIHGILERADNTAIVEQRLYATRLDKKISGKFDRFVYKDGILQDYKVTAVWALLNAADKSDWLYQLNTYRWLLTENNIPVNKLQIVAILRDWSKREARLKSADEYPKKQVAIVDIPILPPDEFEKILLTQLQRHIDAETNLPLCTPEERWLRPGKTAVMKEGNKKALKLFLDSTEATTWLSQQKDSSKLYLAERPSEAIRCLDYCSVGQQGLCAQWEADPTNPKKVFAEVKQSIHGDSDA